MTKRHTWFELSLGVGDERLPMALKLRLDGYTMLEITDVDDNTVIDTLLDADQLTDLITALTLVRDAALEMPNG